MPGDLGRDRKSIGERLRLTRDALGMGQKEFAEAASLKASALNQYESGKYMPNIESAHALCDRYSLTFDWIFRGDMSGLKYDTAQAIHAMRKLRKSATSKG